MLLPTDCRDRNKKLSLNQISFNMKIAKKKFKFQTTLVKPIIDRERPLEKMLKKGGCLVIKCYNTPGGYYSGSYEINLSYYGGGSPGECFFGKTYYLRPWMANTSVRDLKGTCLLLGV